MVRKMTETSTVFLVLQALRDRDDFMTRQMLEAATGRKSSPIAGALHHLRKMNAVDVVINPDGQAWWYALPPEGDKRSRSHDEHVPYPTGIKRRSKKKPLA